MYKPEAVVSAFPHFTVIESVESVPYQGADAINRLSSNRGINVSR
jgi:hypothetical protein